MFAEDQVVSLQKMAPGNAPTTRLRFTAIAALLAVAFVAIAAERTHTLHEVPNRDVMLYAVIGHELLAGRPLYSDLWDHKPPLIYASYAAVERLTGYGEQMFYVLAVVLSCWTAAMIAWSAAPFGPAAAFWGVLLWVLAWNAASIEGNEPNAELFMNALIATAFGILVTARTFTAIRASLFGLLIALITLFKPYGLVYGVLPLVVLSDRQWCVRRNLVAIPLAVAAVWIPLIVYFAATGRTQILVDSLLTFNSRYAGSMPLNLAVSFLPPFTPAAYMVLVPLLVVAAGSLVSQYRYGGLRTREWSLLIALIVLTHVSVALPGRFFGHYFQLWLPPLIIAAAWSAASVRIPILLIGAGMFLAAVQIRDLRREPDDWSRQANMRDESPLASRQLGLKLRRQIPGCEFGLNVGSEVGVYFYGRFRPAAGTFYQSHVDTTPLGDELYNRIGASQRYAPCFLTVGKKTINVNERLEHLVPSLVSAQGFERDERLSDDLFDVYLRR
jgi:hypothetical protein